MHRPCHAIITHPHFSRHRPIFPVSAVGVGSRPNYGDEVGQTGTNPMRGYLINAAGRRLNLTACFTNVNKTQCTVPAGSGSGYTVYYEVKVNLGAWVPVIFPTPIVVSYMPPTVTRLDFNKNLATGSPTVSSAAVVVADVAHDLLQFRGRYDELLLAAVVPQLKCWPFF